MGKRIEVNRPTVARLHAQLASAGLPVVTVRLRRGELEVEYGPTITPAQRAIGDSIVAAFDMNTEDAQVTTVRQLRADMTTAGFARLTGVEKLERIRAALELLLSETP